MEMRGGGSSAEMKDSALGRESCGFAQKSQQCGLFICWERGGGRLKNIAAASQFKCDSQNENWSVVGRKGTYS